MGFKVLLYTPLSQIASRLIQESGIDITFTVAQQHSKANICAQIVDCDALLIDGAHKYPVDREIIDAGKNLKVLICESIGYEFIDTQYATEQGIYILNGAGTSTVSVAESTIHLILGCVRNAQQIYRRFYELRENYPFATYNDPLTQSIELRGRTLGLIGCGAIGREVAKIAARGFSMQVIGYDPYLKEFPEDIEPRRTKEEIFQESDFVSLHLHSNPETRGSIGAKEFALMKPTSYFINVSRGDIVREPELIEALQKGEIKGAGLDVYQKEPIAPESYALFDTNFVYMTPHNAAASQDAENRYEEFKALNILEAARRKTLTRKVNDPEHPRLFSD